MGRLCRWVAIVLAIVLVVPATAGVAGAEVDAGARAGAGSGQRPEIDIPDGPFSWPTGRRDTSVPGDGRVGVGMDDRAVLTPEPVADGAPEWEPSEATSDLPSVEGRGVFTDPDGPLSEVSELITGADGARGIEVSAQRRWFEDADGRWREIDVRLAYERGDRGVVVSRGDRVSYRFESSGSGVTVSDENGRAMSFRPKGADVLPVLGADGRSVTYREVWPGVDVVYSVSSGGLKEDVVLKRRQRKSEFEFVVDGGELVPVEQRTGVLSVPGSMRLRVGGVDTDLVVLPPVATDANGELVLGETSKIALVSEVTGESSQRLVLSAGQEWLNGLRDDEFPVRLDPLVGVGSSMGWVTLAMFRATTASGVSCTYPPTSGCWQEVGYTTGYNFRTHVAYDLTSVWSTIASNPGIVVSNAAVETGAGSAPDPSKLLVVREQMPSGQELNYWASNVMPIAGSGTTDASGVGLVDITSSFNAWRVAYAGGDTSWAQPVLALNGNESSEPSRV